MPQISLNQIFTMLFVATSPVAFIISPRILTAIVGQSAWLAVLSTLIPGTLVVYAYIIILQYSSRPFPLMLEDHLGRVAGRILAFIYIFVFLFSTALILRTFVSFVESNVLPGLPISIMIALMLLPAFYAIRSGLEISARVFEIVFLAAFPLVVFLLLMAMAQESYLKNLLPLAYSNYQDLAYGSLQILWLLGSMFIVLTLAYFSNDRSQNSRILFKALFSFIILITLTATASIITLGANLSSVLAFPMFSISRSISLGGFIRNIEIVSISMFMVGIFISLTIHWFMACYTCKEVFRLTDYRFLAAPTSLFLGFLSIILGPNISSVFLILEKIAPVFFSIFYVGIPLLLAVILLFKPPVNPELGTGLQAPLDGRRGR